MQKRFPIVMWSMWYSVIFTYLHHKLELLDKLNTYLCKYYPLKKICLHHPATFHKISIFLIFHYSRFWVMKTLELQKYKRRIEDWNGPSIRQLQENIPMPAIPFLNLMPYQSSYQLNNYFSFAKECDLEYLSLWTFEAWCKLL